jgi:hypothetical protein
MAASHGWVRKTARSLALIGLCVAVGSQRIFILNNYLSNLLSKKVISPAGHFVATFPSA